MDFLSNDIDNSFREQLAGFCNAETAPSVAQRDANCAFEEQKFQKLIKHFEPFLQDALLTEGQATTLRLISSLETLGYICTDGGLNFSLSAHLLAGVIPLMKFGTATQKEKYLEAARSGKLILANAITEAQSGSAAFSMTTHATTKGENFILNGNKAYISNATVAGAFIIYAATDADKGYHGGITAFIAENNTMGFSVSQPLEKMGLRSCPMANISMSGLELGKEQVLGGVGGGSAVFSYAMDWERTGIAATHIGTIQRILDQAVVHCRERQSGGESISKKQSVAHKLAELKAQLEAGRLLVYRAAQNVGAKDNALHSSIAKLFVSELYTNASRLILQLYGAEGYLRGSEIERVYRDAAAATIHSGTSDIQKNQIAAWLGL
jgi:alkylation response protein AidB-like acyl-CoA dehydrogenase